MTNNRCTASTTPMPDIEPVISYTCTRLDCDGQHSAPLKWRRREGDTKIVEEIPSGPQTFTWSDDFAAQAGWVFTPNGVDEDYDPRPHQEMQPMIDYLETRNEVYGGEWEPEDY